MTNSYIGDRLNRMISHPDHDCIDSSSSSAAFRLLQQSLSIDDLPATNHPLIIKLKSSQTSQLANLTSPKVDSCLQLVITCDHTLITTNLEQVPYVRLELSVVQCVHKQSGLVKYDEFVDGASRATFHVPICSELVEKTESILFTSTNLVTYIGNSTVANLEDKQTSRATSTTCNLPNESSERIL